MEVLKEEEEEEKEKEERREKEGRIPHDQANYKVGPLTQYVFDSCYELLGRLSQRYR